MSRSQSKLARLLRFRRLTSPTKAHVSAVDSAVRLLAIAACCMLLVSCVPFLTAKKDDPPSKPLAEDSPALKKATIPDDVDSLPRSMPMPKEGTSPASVVDGGEPGKAPTPETGVDSTGQRSHATRDRFPERVMSAKAEREESPLKVPNLPPPRSVPAHRGPGSAGSPTEKDVAKTAPGADEKKAEAPLGRIEKYDHAKYKDTIRNKAMALVNKEPSCFLARLCHDSITDRWSLNIYQKDQKTYSFVAYEWDTVAASWARLFDSGKHPLKKWKNHITASESQRNCSVLKGSLR